MADITNVLSIKYSGMEWSLNGTPTTEEEFNSSFTMHDAHGKPEPTWAKLQEYLVEVQADEDAKEYQRDRVKSSGYASTGDQFDMQYKDLLNGTTVWKDHVAKVKSDNPKE
jgi:hypothetical protein